MLARMGGYCVCSLLLASGGVVQLGLPMLTRFVAARSPPKLLFLDIDGVLNSADWYARQRNGFGDLAHFDPTLVRRVDEVAGRTGAAVVISSAWRLSHPFDELRTLLRRAGLVRAPIIGETPEIEGGILDGLVRAVEILHWRGPSRRSSRAGRSHGS